MSDQSESGTWWEYRAGWGWVERPPVKAETVETNEESAA